MKIMFLLWLSSSHWLASGGDKVPPDSENRRQPTNAFVVTDLRISLLFFSPFTFSRAPQPLREWKSWVLRGGRVVVVAWSPPLWSRLWSALQPATPHCPGWKSGHTIFYPNAHVRMFAFTNINKKPPANHLIPFFFITISPVDEKVQPYSKEIPSFFALTDSQ